MNAKKNFILIIVGSLVWPMLMACGDMRSSSRDGQTTFSTPGRNPTDPEAPKAEAPLTPEERIEREALRAAPMILKGEVRNSMPAYQVPEKLRERLQEVSPELVAPRSRQFEVFNQHLHIRAKDHSMTFTGVLRMAGKQDETIELKCTYDPASAPWSCDQMYPTDPKVAAERRLQATVNCLDTQRCERVGMELFVVVNGKTESQLFQNQKFSARRATSGDAEERVDGLKRLPKPVPVGPLKPREPKVLEKPRPEPIPTPTPRPSVPESPQPTTPAPESTVEPEAEAEVQESQTPELTEPELQQVMEDPNQALEITAPMPVPRPARGQFSIPGIETLRPETGTGVKPQAIGFHNAGALRNGTTLSASGPGFLCRGRADRNYGTELTIQLLRGASLSTDKKFPNKSPFVIANISKQGGGRLCNGGSCHASHQTGLDVDIVFPSQKRVTDMWSLCGPGGCRAGGKISDDFDEERFFHFVKTLVGAEGRPVIAFFIDTQIKRHMCAWAKKRGEDVSTPDSPAFRALQAMKHEPGHHNHVHVRFKCPGNRDCRDATVSLGRGTGC